ncbi:MAG TPA: outer membrane beta-barrel protein [Gemmatimonadales bacterium]|nr:outer membrane beta-barrel protein [Gemmatimonadales bacterium]
MSLGRQVAWISLFIAVPASSAGQVLMGYLAGSALSSETFNIGFEVGMNFATLTGLGAAERKNAPLFGLFGDWRFSQHAHLTTGLLPISSRGATGLHPLPIGDPTLDPLVASGTMTRSISTLDIPILLKYAPQRDVGVRFGAGPDIAFVTGATDRYTTQSPGGAPVVVERDIGDQIAGVDAGVAFDFELRWPLLAIGIRYYEGLTDLIANNTGTPSRTRILSGSGRIALGRKTSAK